MSPVFPDGIGDGITKKQHLFLFPQENKMAVLLQEKWSEEAVFLARRRSGPLPAPRSPLQGLLNILKLSGMESGPQTKNPGASDSRTHPLLSMAVAKGLER